MKAADVFKALADGNRLRIVAALLEHKELCACQLTELLGVAGATASRHLAQLQQVGLLERRKKGRWILYGLRRPLPLKLPLDWFSETLQNDAELQNDLKKLEDILSVDPEIICQRQRGSKKTGSNE